MHLKITTQNKLSPFFKIRFFRDFWWDYDNLSVAIDPNVS